MTQPTPSATRLNSHKWNSARIPVSSSPKALTLAVYPITLIHAFGGFGLDVIAPVLLFDFGEQAEVFARPTNQPPVVHRSRKSDKIALPHAANFPAVRDDIDPSELRKGTAINYGVAR